MSTTADNATNSGPKPLIGLKDLKLFFDNPIHNVKPDNNVDIERNSNEETLTSLEHDHGSDVTPDHTEPLLGISLDRIQAVFGGYDPAKDSVPYADGRTAESIGDHHINTQGDGEKERNDKSYHSPNPPNSEYDTSNDKWWPMTAESDHAGGEVKIESRFNEPSDPPPPPPPVLKVAVDVNAYQQRKNLAHGMMDLALLSANANQLRYVMECETHPYYYPSLVLVSLSIIFQVGVGILLIWNSQYDVTQKVEICKAIRVNNVTVAGVFLVSIINVFISSFSVTPTSGMLEAVRRP